MKNKKTRLGLSILAGGLSFVGAANAMDLIGNGSFENPPPGGWMNFATYNFASAYYTGDPIPSSENPGSLYSWQHASAFGAWDNFVTPTNLTDHLQYNLQFADSQTVHLTNALTTAAVDAGLGRYSFSCWLASYGQPSQNPEQPFVVLRFFDSGTTQISTNIIFDRTTNIFALTYATPAKGHSKGPYVPADLTTDHDWIKYQVTNNVVPVGARKATVYITRSPKTGLSGKPDTYVDLLKLNVIDSSQNTIFASSYPADGQTGVTPDTVVTVGLQDNTKQVNTSSILFWFDTVKVTPSISKAGDLTTVQYDPPGLMASLSAHTCKVAWSDNATPVQWKTNLFAFTVAPYMNVNLGTPIARETFDGIAPGALPAGWTVVNHTDYDTYPGPSLDNFHSDTFMDWTVIGYTNLTNWFTIDPGGPDFIGALNVAPNQYINGAAVTNLISTNFIIAVGDRGDMTTKQIDYLYTGDYNLSGHNDVYLSFHNIYVQNVRDIASVEYSIDGGTTWQPALYMLDPFRIFRDSAGNIDAYTTFNWIYWWDVPGGQFGQYIGVDSSRWSTLAPYISPRANADQSQSKRVEVIRLAQADNQPAVRFRMAYAGTWGWYFGIDNFGLYSISPSTVSPPLVTGGPTPTPQTLTAGNMAYLTVAEPLSVAPFSYQWRHNGTDLPGKTGQALYLSTTGTSDSGSYDVVVTNPGGSTTSSVAVLTVLDQRPMKVTGQWDFLQGDLKASYGTDLQYFDSTVQADTTFGTTTSFGIPDVGYIATPTTVMHFNPSTAGTGPWGGYKMYHGAAPNGGGAYVNQYTLIFDIYYPMSSDGKWRSLWQTSTGNPSDNDGDLFVSNWNGLGISSVYDGWLAPAAWNRIAFGFDLSGPGEAPVLTKFINGVKQPHNVDGITLVNQVLEQGTDGRWSLDPYALVFGDNDGDVAEAYVSSIQFSDGRRPDAYIQALGGPNALKIPGIIRADLVSGQVVIRWSGGVPLQSADSLSGPWTSIDGTAGQYTYTPSPLEQRKFYRPQIP